MANKYYDKYKDKGMGPQLMAAMMIEDELEEEEREAKDELLRIEANIDASIIAMGGPEFGEALLSMRRLQKKIAKALYEQYSKENDDR